MHDPDSHAHEHDAGHEVHAHTPGSALKNELISHLPLSVASAAMGLVFAGIICFFALQFPELGDELQKPETVAEVAHTHTPAHEHDHNSVDHKAASTEHEHDHGTTSTQTYEPEKESHTHNHTATCSHGHEHGAGEHDHCHEGRFKPLFHLFHPLHMLFSAAATTAMFWAYDRRVIRAIIVGLIGAIGVCGLSDIFVPHLSLMILGHDIPLHICVIDHPGMVLPFAAIGILLGLCAAIGVSKSTFYSHSLHVFVSTMASIFYMVDGYNGLSWINQLGVFFFFVVIAVVFPCCLSDIVFPIAMSKSAREQHARSACCH